MSSALRASLSVPTETGPKNVADILAAAADLIEPEGAWTQGRAARDIHANPAEPDDDSAVCWCGIGAVMRVARLARADEAEMRACWALQDMTEAERVGGFGPFNDASERTQAEVVAALREAARVAAQSTTEPVGIPEGDEP